jgi:release factor glutamine methyltransferase
MVVNFSQVKKNLQTLYKQHNINEKSEQDWLFSHVLKLDRAKLFTVEEITKKEHNKIQKIANKRVKGIPLSKIIKNCNFYGNDFLVNKNVLTPRQETEILVEKVINDYKNTKNISILDLCTGSGIIAVTLKKYLQAEITASDISNKALKVAKKNAKSNKVKLSFLKSDLFNKINKKYDVIVCNPPYIKSSKINSLQTEVKNHDPLIALDGGVTGLNFYKKIIKNAPQNLSKSGRIYLELGKGQHKQVAKMLENRFKDINIIKDYNNIERIVYATKK